MGLEARPQRGFPPLRPASEGRQRDPLPPQGDVLLLKACAEIRVPNPQGLHARPAQLLVATANRFRAEVRVRHGEIEANGKSILDVMTLNAPQGSLLRFETEGEDAQAALQALQELVLRGFDEM